MFKNIQNHLLLRYPLLWNTKIVPVLAGMIILHLLFFITGYINGQIDFTHTGFGYFSYDSDSPTAAFLSIFLSILVFVIWLVFYFRNNAYKSFYPLSPTALYKEWLIIALVCVLNCGYSASYFYAKDLRRQTYMTEEEMVHRLDILSISLTFIDGGFERPYEIKKVDGENKRIPKTSITFKGKEYSLESLMNKSLHEFSYQNKAKDSLNKLRVMTWLAENKKDSVLWLMKEFEKIAKEHQLKSNINPEKWLSLTYNAPDFTKFAAIGKIESYPVNENYHYYDYANQDYEEEIVAPATVAQPAFDPAFYTIKDVKNVSYAYAKYYVPALQLNNSYDKISESWTSPEMNTGLGLVYLYFGFALSMAIFSFRVTTGRSWLIAFVALGVTALVTGIFSMITSGDLFAILWLVITIALLIAFVMVCNDKTGKGQSAIVLNNLLWLSIWLVPQIILILETSFRHSYDGYKEAHPMRDWIRDNATVIMYVNLLFTVVYMYFLSVAIRKWKGIPED